MPYLALATDDGVAIMQVVAPEPSDADIAELIAKTGLRVSAWAKVDPDQLPDRSQREQWRLVNGEVVAV